MAVKLLRHAMAATAIGGYVSNFFSLFIYYYYYLFFVDFVDVIYIYKHRKL